MDLSSELCDLLDVKRVLTRPIDRIAYGSDASLYRLIPQAVVQPVNIDEIQKLFSYSHIRQIPITFRAAGTSLSGQGVTDGILVDLSRSWRKIIIENNGDLVRLGPGVIGSDVNTALKPYKRRIGPDPASIDAAMLGGMVANNASGMCCGVLENSYHTLHSLTIVLPNGLLLNTAEPEANQKLMQGAPEIAKGLMDLKSEIESQPELSARIRSKYRTKNTTGYSLNAFIDFENPVDILAHLMVGSEGTLGFIAEIVLHTLPDFPLKYTGLLIFETIKEACDAVFPLSDSGARAIEFMDRPALRSVEDEPGISSMLVGLPENVAALLVEYQVNTEDELENVKNESKKVLAGLHLIHPVEFTTNAAQQAMLWKIRKGLYPSIGGMRRQGTTVLIEDVAFEIRQLAEAALDLQALFKKHGYNEAIIFGHAKDGNLHFVLTPSFNDEASIARYAKFMDDVVDLVTRKYKGALKAEHGTGRNMAPFIEAEWGCQAAAIMRGLKELIDPTNLLNPGVIINPDPTAHLKNLKPWPQVEEEVDKCIECGFCEPKCASRDLTLTPRRRIVVRREITRLQNSGEDPAMLASLVGDYCYDGLETCAVDGYCMIGCPVHINTGDLVKRLRTEAISPNGQDIASTIGRHFELAENGLRIGIVSGHVGEKIIGIKGVAGVSILGEKISGTTLPKWIGVVPRANFKIPKSKEKSTETLVYFPSCITRVMGTSPTPGDGTLPEIILELCRRAGMNVWIPPDSAGNCCGMPFSSKGYSKAFHEMLHRTLEKFWEWSECGRLPVVIDSSSCAYTLFTSRKWLDAEELEKLNNMKLMDPIEWIHSTLLANIKIRQKKGSVVLHPNCSAVKLGLADKMVAIANACAEKVTVPINLKCCGFAGDRGLLFPELTASASSPEAEEVNRQEFDGYFSSNLTCEMGMSQATGKPYRSILYLLEEASR
jgi:D-lactate dehydrogenase